MNLHPHAVQQLLWMWYTTASLYRYQIILCMVTPDSGTGVLPGDVFGVEIRICNAANNFVK